MPVVHLPADPDRPVKAFLQEYQTLFGFGPEALDERSAVIYTLLISSQNKYFCKWRPRCIRLLFR